MRRRAVPVSALARFAADPHAFSRRRTPAMEKAAEHGIRWHAQLGRGRPGATPGWRVAVAVALVLVGAAAVALLLAP